MMHMTFYWSREVTLLIDSWKTESWTSYGLTLLACLLFSIFYQYMEARRNQFQRLSVNAKPSPVATQTAIDAPLLYPNIATTPRIWSPASIAGAVLFGINSAIGYLLMLAIMSFNGGVFVAIVAGLAVGYLVFRSSGEDVVVLDNPCACA